MSVAEMAARGGVQWRKRRWRRLDRRPDGLSSLIDGPDRHARAALPSYAVDMGGPAASALLASADRLLAGKLTVFGRDLSGFGADPDWFTDPVTGTTSDAHAYCFDLPYRDESRVGNIKFVWEPSRALAAMQLASAWRVSRNESYACRALALLESWWRHNPFLQGVHWVSGIEVGLRLLSWSWIRALLDDWPGCGNRFDTNPIFLAQLYHHQVYLRAFLSSGSSANNHLLAELAGLATASVVFPWFAESSEWSSFARAELIAEAKRQTFGDGFNREQAMDYHLFVLDILMSADLAARFAGDPLGRDFDDVLCRMSDALAASLDGAGQPPRFGDGDDGRALLLDGGDTSHVASLLGAAAARFGRATWWPERVETILERVAAALQPVQPPDRDVPLPALMAEAGHAFLRYEDIWLRCDHGRLGFLSIAAHGHADALSLELRVAGTEILADPGTYCYHGEPIWRGYFKSTLGHNSLTVDGRDQADGGGPFLWLTDVPAQLARWEAAADGGIVWQASHAGYRRLPDPVTHHRRVVLSAVTRSIEITDWIGADKGHDVTLAFHFGPAVSVLFGGDTAQLDWMTDDGRRCATMRLPSLRWSLHRGETDPPRGWHSAGFARKQPAFTLLGHGHLLPGGHLLTQFHLPRYSPSVALAKQEAPCPARVAS
jgi:hypothetical protein